MDWTVARRGRSSVLSLALPGVAGTVASLVIFARIDHTGPLATRALAPIVQVPVGFFFALAATAIVAVVAVRVWWVALALFLLWLPFEDLVRKFDANDLRVYFVKDLLLLLAFVAASSRLVGCWRRPLGRAWAPTLAVFAVAAIMSLPTAARDVRVPLGAMQLRFIFVPLLPIGVYVGRSRRRLTALLVYLCLISIGVCALGIAQSLVDLRLLNPSVVDPHLRNLTITKVLGSVVVVRPPGPFVDAGRFGTYTTVAMVLGACLLQLAAGARGRSLAYATLAVAGWATFISGGRTALLFAAAIAGFALFLAGPPALRRNRRLVFGLAAIVVGGAAAVHGINLGNSNAEFYAETLSLNGSHSELLPRVGYYAGGLRNGLVGGRALGRGTGDQAIGQQYFTTPTYTAESGFGSIATEWGVFGLGVWVWWTVAWIRRCVEATRFPDAPSGPVTSTIALFVVLNMTIGFALGIQYFENFITNAFLWLLSGVAFAACLKADYVPQTPTLSAVSA